MMTFEMLCSRIISARRLWWIHVTADPCSTVDVTHGMTDVYWKRLRSYDTQGGSHHKRALPRMSTSKASEHNTRHTQM
jgi:hypothetical protein